MGTNIPIDTNRSDNKPELLHPELSYTINGILFTTHNEIGCYGREKQYADTVETRFKENGILYKRELQIGSTGNILDFLVEDKIILELKAKRALPREDFRQLQNYLQQTGKRLGLLVNFHEKFLKPRRIVLIERRKWGAGVL